MSKAKKIGWREYWPYLAMGVVSLVFLATTLKGKGKKGNGAALPIPDGGGLAPEDGSAIDFRDRTDLPRGMRNNNPGNIVIAGNDWRGKVPVAQNTDKKFEQFETYQYGIRAMIVLLKNYIDRYGLKTLSSIITRWCSGGCDLNVYMQVMTQVTGYTANQPLTANRETLKRLVRGIAQVEQGQDGSELIIDNVFNRAWELL